MKNKNIDISDIRELDARTFKINVNKEQWNVVIDKKLQHTRLHFTAIANDMVIKVISKYLIETLKHTGTYVCVFRQNKNDNKKFLVKFEINIDLKSILILRIKRDINKSYVFDESENFYYYNDVYLEDFTNKAVERKMLNKKAEKPSVNKVINTNGLRIVKKLH